MTRKAKSDDKSSGYLVAALVLGFSLFMGLVVLPRLGARAARSSELVGKMAPDFVLPYVSPAERGKQQRLSDLQGRAVVLDFWASWCAPCRAQTPVLERLAKRFGPDKLVVLGVGTSDDRQNIERFLEATAPKYASVYDDQSVAPALYDVRSLPTVVVIAKDGTVKAVTTGLASEERLAGLIGDALK